MEIEIVEEAGQDSLTNERTTHAVYVTRHQYRNLYSRHQSEEEAAAQAHWLKKDAAGENAPKPTVFFWDKKYNGLSGVGARIMLSQLKKRDDLKVYQFKTIELPYPKNGKFYIKGTLTT